MSSRAEERPARRCPAGACRAAAAAAIASSLLSPGAWAVVENPFPNLVEDDAGEVSIVPVSGFVALQYEVAQQGDLTGEFGFYFLNGDPADPENVGALFDVPEDGASLVRLDIGRVISLGNGTVLDTFSESGPIGFVLTVDGVTVYSEPERNPGGVDVAGIYQNLDPMEANDYVVGFYLGNLGEESGFRANDVFFAYINAPQIPVPPALPLLLSALGGLGFLARRR